MRVGGIRIRLILIVVSILILVSAMSAAHAEPYLAVQQGLKCMQCHLNPSGGGERTLFGEVFAQNVMPARHVDTGDRVWTGMLNDFVGFGGNLRADAEWQQVRGRDAVSAFGLQQARAYLSVAMIPERLLVYMDEQLAPGTAVNREAWAQLWLFDKKVYVKAGQMYLPFGFRLQDQNAYIGQLVGINMTTPDHGVELGFEQGAWDGRIAVSNGASGGVESDNNKQFTGQLAYVMANWRLGVGFDLNRLAAGQLRGGTLFTGVRTGPVVWLAEIDWVSAPITVNSTARRVTQAAALLEADWLVARGHNIKVVGERLDPNRDVSGDARTRLSAIYEWTPMQFLQLRTGWRRATSQTNVDALHQQQAFVELHAFF